MRSLFRFVPGCFLLVFATITQSTGTDNNNECTTLYDKFAKGRVYITAILESRMLIITKDFPPLVYDVSVNKVTTDSVDMYQVKPESMDTKWPEIFNFPDYKRMAQRISTEPSFTSSFAIKLDKELVVFYDGISSGDKDYIVTYTGTLDPVGMSRVFYEIGDTSFQYATRYISSDEPNVYYNLYMVRDLTYHLHRYVYEDKIFRTKWHTVVCVTIDQDTPTMSFYENSTKCVPFNWTIQTAFTYQNHFYLISLDHVYKIPFQKGSIVGTKEIVTIVPLSNYFQCIGPTTVPPSTLSTLPTSNINTTCSNVTLSNSTESNTEDLQYEMIKPLDIAVITMSLILIFVLVSICVWEVLTSEGEDHSVPNLKGPSNSRVYVSNSLDSMFKERRTTHTQ